MSVHLFHGVSEPIDSVGEGNVLWTNGVAAPAADAHCVAEARFVVEHFVQNLESHALAVGFAVAAAAGDIGKAVDHAAGPDATTFADAAVFAVENVLHGEAGAAWADKIAAPAGDALVSNTIHR